MWVWCKLDNTFSPIISRYSYLRSGIGSPCNRYNINKLKGEDQGAYDLKVVMEQMVVWTRYCRLRWRTTIKTLILFFKVPWWLKLLTSDHNLNNTDVGFEFNRLHQWMIVYIKLAIMKRKQFLQRSIQAQYTFMIMLSLEPLLAV